MRTILGEPLNELMIALELLTTAFDRGADFAGVRSWTVLERCGPGR